MHHASGVSITVVCTHAFTVTSRSNTAVGINISPSQKTGEVNNILSLPNITAPTFNTGQKLLHEYKKVI